MLSNDTKATIFAVTDTKSYVPVATLSTQDNTRDKSKNAERQILVKCKYTSYSIGFDSYLDILFADGSLAKIVTIFGADIRSSVDTDNNEKGILSCGKRPIQEPT